MVQQETIHLHIWLMFLRMKELCSIKVTSHDTVFSLFKLKCSVSEFSILFF